jgi:vancomycin resistance protein VanJ
MRRWLWRAPEVALAACLAPLAVRVLFRDRVPSLAPLTYATPLCVLAALAALGWALAWRLERRALGRVAGALALVLGLWTVAANVSLHPLAQPGRYRGLLWNIEAGKRGWERVAEQVRAEDPDVAAFIDVGHKPGIRSPALKRALPDSEIYDWNDALAIAVRGRIVHSFYYPLGTASHAGVARVELADGRRLTVVIVHPRSAPTESRAGVFKALADVLEPLRSEPLLVVGDFNTPSDSVYFDPIRREFHSAFETAGMGYAASWPMPVPLLAIDQVWSTDSVPIRSCHLSGSLASDHRLVAFSFD